MTSRRTLAWLALLLCLVATAATVWAIYPAAFYRDHGFSPAGLDRARPTTVLSGQAFFFENYRWALARCCPHVDATLHVNRILWVFAAVGSFAVLVWTISRSLAATLLGFVLFLNMPTLASARMWSGLSAYNIAGAAGCLCLACEWRNVAAGPTVARRLLATILYFVSVLAAEFFFYLPLFFLVLPFVHADRTTKSRAAAWRFSRSAAAWYVLPMAFHGVLSVMSRKDFAESGSGLLTRVFTVPYAKSVIGQLASNLGDRFFLFLYDNLTCCYDALSLTTLVYLGGFALAASALFVVIVRAEHGERPAAMTSASNVFVVLGVTIVGVSAAFNSLAIYSYSLGYNEDRTNQASAVGAALVLIGFLSRLAARARFGALVATACCILLLFSALKAARLQAMDWTRVRAWEVGLTTDYRDFLSRHPEALGDRFVVVHGFPRYVSSFPFDPRLIWFAYYPPELKGTPGPYYRVPVADIERDRAPWRERLRRHVSRGYRFWPMLIAPIHPTGEHLSGGRGVTLVHVDHEFGIGCSPTALVLPVLVGGRAQGFIVPTEASEMVFGEWRPDARTRFRRVRADECRAIADDFERALRGS